jgi:hypothetical protein
MGTGELSAARTSRCKLSVLALAAGERVGVRGAGSIEGLQPLTPLPMGEGADRVRRNRRHCRARPGNPSSSQNVFRRMMDPRVKPAGDGSRWSSLPAMSCPARSQACADRVNLSALPGIHVLLSSSAKDRMARELERLVPPRAPTYTRPASILRECDTAHTSLLTLSLKSRQGKKDVELASGKRAIEQDMIEYAPATSKLDHRGHDRRYLLCLSNLRPAAA